MPRLRLSIETPFGEIQVSGESPEEVLEALGWLDRDFVVEVNSRVSSLMAEQARNVLEGIVDVRRDGPVIVTRDDMSHYEAIGLILYAYKDHEASSRMIKERLSASGKKVTVPARLNEMRKRGHIFKPNSREPIYKLSTQGVRWIEEEVLPKLDEN